MADAINILNFKRSLSYHHWRFAWYSFLDFLTLTMNKVFVVPSVAKIMVWTLICDATALSFRQELCTSLKPSMNDSSIDPLNHDEQEDKLLLVLMFSSRILFKSYLGFYDGTRRSILECKYIHVAVKAGNGKTF